MIGSKKRQNRMTFDCVILLLVSYDKGAEGSGPPHIKFSVDESKSDPELQTAYSQGGGAEGPGALHPKAEG